jgi:hypothetical protein
MVVAAEEIVGPGRGLIQGPVSGRDVTFFQRLLLSVGFEPFIGADVNASLLPRKNFTPAFRGATTLAVEEKFRTLRLGAEKGHLGKRAISAAAAAGREKLDPVFQLRKRAFES